MVVKYGGSTMGGGDTVHKDIVFMQAVGICPVVVHGGGPAINRCLQALGIESQRVDGLRVTDAATMKVVEDVLFGEVNARIVREIGVLDGRAVGVSAKDAGIMQVCKHWAQTDGGAMDIGYVGDVEHVDTAPLLGLIDKGMIPVVAPIGRGPESESFNVNADTAAGEIAAALHAEKLVFLTDVQGIMRDLADDASLLSTVHVSEVGELIDQGVICGGMIPKSKPVSGLSKPACAKLMSSMGACRMRCCSSFTPGRGIGTQIVQ